MIRVALAGFAQGYYAVTYMRYLAGLKGIQPVAVCDCGESDAYVLECAFIKAADFAQELGVPLVHDYAELLALKPDALLICSETADHPAMAAQALRQGIHVFVSKPLAFSKAGLAELKSAYSGSHRFLCGNPLKYEQGIEELHSLAASGKIGRVYSTHITVNHLAMTQQVWERDASRSGGPLGTYGVYPFDLARWITGENIAEVYAQQNNFATPAITAADTVSILAKGETGSLFTLALYSGIRHDFPFVQVQLVGEKGTLISNYQNHATLLQAEEGTSLGALRSSDMGRAEMDHFIACIHREEAERCSLADMEYVAACLEAVGQSVNQNAPVRVQYEDNKL